MEIDRARCPDALDIIAVGCAIEVGLQQFVFAVMSFQLQGA